MEVRVTANGEGTVTGGGAYSAGDSVTLTATPKPGAGFSHFVKDGEVVTSNPYTFTVTGSASIEVAATFFTTIEAYLRAAVGFSVPDAALTKIRIDRGIPANEDAERVSEQTRELAYADLLMWGATLPTQVQGRRESDFGWSSQEGSLTLSAADKRQLRSTARAIYRRYDDRSCPATVRLISLVGGKLYGSK